jgi:quinol monooxygenase YgiN
MPLARNALHNLPHAITVWITGSKNVVPEIMEKSMIISNLKINVAPERREAILDILYSLLEPTRVIPGCIGCNLYQDMENENVLFYSEIWQDQPALDRHILSDLYRSILFAMDMGTEPPEIEFKRVSHCFGMEIIEALRHQSN